MSRRTPTRDAGVLLGMPATLAVLALAQMLEGGRLRTLLQPTAALVVFGGTFAALLVSFPLPVLRRTLTAVRRIFRPIQEPTRTLIDRFGQYAQRSRRRGIMALEPDIAAAGDPFLARALALVVDGVPAADLKEALQVASDLQEDNEEESAQVLESAAGYAPTLGILGAVLGLIHVMENLAEPASIGSGIAVAFVATVYGVGSANLLLMPLATRVRTHARTSARGRELTIEGAVALRQGLHPRLIEAHLEGFSRASA